MTAPRSGPAKQTTPPLVTTTPHGSLAVALVEEPPVGGESTRLILARSTKLKRSEPAVGPASSMSAPSVSASANRRNRVHPDLANVELFADRPTGNCGFPTAEKRTIAPARSRSRSRCGGPLPLPRGGPDRRPRILPRSRPPPSRPHPARRPSGLRQSRRRRHR